MTALLGSLLVGGGVAALVVAPLLRHSDRMRALARTLGLDTPPDGDDTAWRGRLALEAGGLRRFAAGLAGAAVTRLDGRGWLAAALERAQLAMRPGEFVLLTGGGGVAAGVAVGVLTRSAALALLPVAVAVPGSLALLRRRGAARRRRFEEQLPDALGLVAASLAGGHTFLRAIQLMCEEAEPPLADEFGRVVHEAALGVPPVDALRSMAGRLELTDLDWVVQAVAIQQQVGGRLAEVLQTVADFVRARLELRREVRVLSAEGRLSAAVLGALPLVLLGALHEVNPGYLQPLLHGAGLAILGLCAVSVAVGVLVIRRQVRIEV